MENIKKIKAIDICCIVILGTCVCIGPFAEAKRLETRVNQGQQQMVLGVNQGGCKICIEILDLLYTEAFRRMNLDFAYKLYPLKRSLFESNNGRIDGETARLEFDTEVKKRYPNLIQVNESIWESTITAYSASSSIQIDGWENLKQDGLLIGYPRGHLFIEKKLEAYHIPKSNLYDTTNVIQGLHMLLSKRLDIMIESDITVEGTLKKKEFKGADIHRAGSLSPVPLFPYLHKKHPDLIPKLAAVLKEMKADGTYKILIKRAQSTHN